MGNSLNAEEGIFHYFIFQKKIQSYLEGKQYAKDNTKMKEGFILHTFNLDEIEKKRYSWGVFRDRRVDLYSPILKHDDSNN